MRYRCNGLTGAQVVLPEEKQISRSDRDFCEYDLCKYCLQVEMLYKYALDLVEAEKSCCGPWCTLITSIVITLLFAGVGVIIGATM
jgi:hypothetical protein